MKPLKTLLKGFCAVTFVSVALAASAQNIVKDPGFELSPGTTMAPGGFNPAFWTLVPPAGSTTTPPTQLSNVGTDPALAHSGNHHANLEYSAQPAPAFGSLQQTLATVVGQVYQVSFWLANFDATPTNTFQVVINGVVLSTNFGSTITSQGGGFPLSNPAVGPNYQLVTAQFTANNASSLLEFRYHHDADFWYLDDVSVAAGVPEGGATLWIVAPLFVGLCLLHARNRRSA